MTEQTERWEKTRQKQLKILESCLCYLNSLGDRVPQKQLK